MISVPGQYYLKFSISDPSKIKDFIDEPDLITFKIIEEAGNLLPIYELMFYTNNEKLFPLLHEGNDIDCTFGKTVNDSITVKLTVTYSNSSRSSQNKRLITVKGVYSSMPYVTNSTLFMSSKKSAIEVLLDKAIQNFGKNNILSNITKSHDSQIWIQPNSTDKKFINELWMHSDLGISFPAIGISTDGKFIVKDIIQDVKGGDKTLMWNFVPNSPKDPKDILYDGNANVEVNSGFINNWLGYGRELGLLQLDSSFDTTVTEEASAFIAQTDLLAKRIEMNRRFASVSMQNSNMHTNYWKSYQHNLVSLASFQNVKVSFTFQDKYKPVRILDKVMFRDGDTSGIGSSEFCTGVYFVSKISRNVTHRQLSTTVILQRESVNAIRSHA